MAGSVEYQDGYQKMISVVFLRNILVILSSFSPLFAIWLSSIKGLNSVKAAVLIEIGFFGLFLFTLFFLPYVPTKTFPSVLSLYPLFLFLFNLIFFLKFGSRMFSKILAVSIMLAFVLTELHELPAFVYSYIHLEFLEPGRLIFFLSPYYALIISSFAAQLFNVSFSRRSKGLLLLSILGLFIFYWINPLIDINGIPSIWVYVKRFYCFVILAAAFLIGGKPENE